MRKLIMGLFVMALCLIPVIPAHAVLVAVDGNLINFDVPPYIDENNRTMVPIRFIAEEMGAEVDYNFDNPMKKEVYINKGDISIVATIDSDKVVVNGQIKTAPTAARVVNGRTMVPLRFCEYLGVTVGWKPESATAHIFTTEKTEEEKQAVMVETAVKQSDGEYEVSEGKITRWDGTIDDIIVLRKNTFPIYMFDDPSTPWRDENTTLLDAKIVNVYGTNFIKTTFTGLGSGLIKTNGSSTKEFPANMYHGGGSSNIFQNEDGTKSMYYEASDMTELLNAEEIWFLHGPNAYVIPNPFKK